MKPIVSKFLFLLLSLSCLSLMKASTQVENPKEGEPLKAILEYCHGLEKKTNLKLKSYGLFWSGLDKVYDGKVHEIHLQFSSDRKMGHEKAKRFFYSSVVDPLLDLLNSNLDLQGQFAHFPLTYKDLHLGISFDYENRGELKVGEVASVVLFENEIFCYVVEKEGIDRANFERASPNIAFAKGFTRRTRTIREKLPD